MPSGKYGAVSGAVARMQMLNNISEHLASAKTPGYKKGVVTFEARLGEATSGMATKATNFSRLTNEEIDFTSGHIEFSGDTLDLAINGDGFFQIQRTDGSTGYTRKGNFQLDSGGKLINTDGFAVLNEAGGELILPNPDVDILQDGTIWDGETQVGKVGLYHFEDTSSLRKAGDEMFESSDDTQPVAHADPQIVQFNLESSNINMIKEMSHMTANMRAFEATQKALKIYSDMDRNAAQVGLVQ